MFQAIRTAFRGLFIGVLTVAASAGLAAAQEQPKPHHVIIGLDLSRSNPLVQSNEFAAKVGERVRTEMGDLPMRSKVTLRTFGEFGAEKNTFQIDRTISARYPSDKAAVTMSTIVKQVPTLVREKRLAVQNMTNIVPFLETMARIIDCEAYDVTIILATDGVEDSEYANLSKPGGRLPDPDETLFLGCQDLVMLGVGQGLRSPSRTKFLIEEWETWAGKAGFTRHEILNDW